MHAPDPSTPAHKGASRLSPAEARGRLVAAFGAPAPWRRRDPVGQLVLALLAQAGDPAAAEARLERLRARFQGGSRSDGIWSELARARPDEAAAALGPAGGCGHEAQAERLLRALNALRTRAGGWRLDLLARLDVEAALDWLGDLPGVEPQAAAAVLGFSTLDRPVMVVDAEVGRAAGRLGLVEPGQAARAAGAQVVAASPAGWTGGDFAELHRLLRRLAQDICRTKRPACAACPLVDACPSAEESAARPKVDVQGWLRRRVERLERGGPTPTPAPGAAGARALSLGAQELDAIFPGGGLASGLHQFSPAAPGDLAAALLPAIAAAARVEAPGAPVRLLALSEADAVREGGDLYGPGLQALGVSAGHIASLRLPGAAEALRAAEAALRLGAAPVVLVELRRGEALADLAVTRRLDLLARRAGAWLLLVTPALEATSAAATRWRVGSAPCAASRVGPAASARRRRLGAPVLHLHLVRNRQGRTGAWSVQWSAHERRFLHVAPLSAPVDAPVFDRPRASGAVAVAAAA